MNLNQHKRIVLGLLGLGITFSLGSYFILYPTFQNIVEKRDLQKEQIQSDISIASWNSIMDSWKPWKSSFEHSLLSPDSLVSLSLKYSLNLQQLHVLASGNEYRFQVEGNLNSICSFIQAIGMKAPHWFFEQFELVKSSKTNLFFFKNVFLNHVSFNESELNNQNVQESEVKNKIKKLISFREQKANFQNINPFESENVVTSKKVYEKQNCRLPSFQIKGVIVDRVLYLEGDEKKTIYKIGDFIGDFRIQKIETKQVLFICDRDTISRLL